MLSWLTLFLLDGERIGPLGYLGLYLYASLRGQLSNASFLLLDSLQLPLFFHFLQLLFHGEVLLLLLCSDGF